ncbi:DUF4194 domain-containing protein [Ottowia testudinis]|uniref:DUF4194 domain-containing protein n=1 Tax=Ottowia testudinis TaxID=2816950 RepID=A0A975CK45_9BURK|nr:DUF4194 domain-containing protein [Ottowia testudinis]QTD47079.1 DUF4194 domain-containing protein [Ottowia testudinis]
MEANLADTARLTPPAVKGAVQELLRSGVVEAEERPKTYELLRQRPLEVAQALEPLDLQCRLDEVRGLAYLSVGRNYAGSESAAAPADGITDASADAADTGWTHPLVRRQRLNLEQSLLLALLRQHYLTHEQQAGVGGGVARASLAELGAELATHLGESGSDRKDDKRLRQLLAGLKEHGVVGDVQDNGQVPIRPLIAHVANPDSLLALLRQFERLTEGGQDAGEGAA